MTVLPDSGEAVLTWNGETISTCAKSFKSAMKLEGMRLDTTEHKGATPDERQHRLTIVNCDDETMVITVPDPLVNLWLCARRNVLCASRQLTLSLAVVVAMGGRH